MKLLEQVIADRRSEAAVLRRHGQTAIADALESFADDVAESAHPFLEWLTETDAMLHSGHSEEWLRKRFPAWERQGLARWNPSRPNCRQYLKVAVPSARNIDAARADAMREAQKVTR